MPGAASTEARAAPRAPARGPGAALRVTALGRGEEGVWDAFVAAHPRATHAHRASWRRVIEDVFGHRTHYLVARRGAEVVGVAPLARLRSRLFGDFMVSVPYLNYGGALGADAGVEQALMDHAAGLAARLGCSHVEFRDRAPRPGGWPARTDKVAMELELPEEFDPLARRLGSKLRSQARRPLREGAQVLHGGRDLLDDFYRVFRRNMRDLGTPVYGRGFFDAVLRTFEGEAGITSVRLDGRPVAAGLVIGWAGRMEIPWASSDRRHNRLGVNMLLYYEVLRRAVEAGYRIFDFGRSTRDGGTYRFKAQWGAVARDLHWHYWLAPGRAMPALTPSNPRFRLAIAAWKRLPLPVAGLIGPHIVKSLP